jgi:hypothetical protein
MDKKRPIIFFILQIIIFVSGGVVTFALLKLTSFGEPKVIIKPSYPLNGHEDILRFDERDFIVTWWLWGPYSVEEQTARYDIPVEVLRNLMRKNINCNKQKSKELYVNKSL